VLIHFFPFVRGESSRFSICTKLEVTCKQLLLINKLKRKHNEIFTAGLYITVAYLTTCIYLEKRFCLLVIQKQTKKNYSISFTISPILAQLELSPMETLFHKVV